MAKKWISFICVWIMALTVLLTPLTVRAQNDSTDETGNTDLIQAPSGVLMEPETGTIIYEKDKDTQAEARPAITKIMTLILFSMLWKKVP